MQPYCLAMSSREAVALQADDRHLRALQAGHGGAEQADGAGPEDDHAVARLDAAVADDGVVRHAAGLGQAGSLKRQVVRHVVQAPRRHADEAGHRAVDAVAEALAVGSRLYNPAGHRVVRVDHGGRLADRPVALCASRRPFAERSQSCPGEFVAQHDGVVDGPTVVRRPLMQIAPAHADGGHFQQHIRRPDLRQSGTSRSSTECFSAAKLTTAG